MYSAQEVTANFAKYEYGCTLTANADPAEGGIVTGSGTYEFHTNVSVEAIPATDCWHFVSWTGDVADSDSPVTTVYTDDNKTVTAHFAKYKATVTANADPAEGGIVTGSGSYECRTNVSVEAIPAGDCWYFVNWTGDVANPHSPTTTVYTDDNKTVTAHFAKHRPTLTANANPAEGGVVMGGGTYECRTNVSVEAMPAGDCWYFVNWTGDVADPDSPTTTVYVDGPKEVTANFALITRNLTIDVSSSFGGDIEIDGTAPASYPHTYTFACGASLDLKAVQAHGYNFAMWSGDLSGRTNPVAIVMDEDKAITAIFSQVTYSIIAETSPNGGGTVTMEPSAPAGGYVTGTEVTLTAVPIKGYEFDHWSGAISGSDNPITLTIDSQQEIMANFAEVVSSPFPWWGIIIGGTVALLLLFFVVLRRLSTKEKHL